MYNTKIPLRVNSTHILDDPANNARFPKSLINSPNLITLLEGAIEVAKKRIDANYRVAVPQYYQGKIQFLIPLCLECMEKPNLALAVGKNGFFYSGKTCLTLEMAYNNARLITKPSNEWLKP